MSSDTNGRREAPARILLVENDAMTLMCFEQLLSGEGYIVETAENKGTALRKVAEQHFDLVITDLGLPDGSGIDLVADMGTAHPGRAIAMTGYNLEPEEFTRAGFDGWLVKPVDFDEMLAMVARLSAPAGDPEDRAAP
jgi:CheY-like chemotaxis protein